MKNVDSNRNVFMLGLVSLFTDLASAMVNPILPLFLVIVLSEGVDKVGIVVAVATLVSYALRFVGGALSDRFNRNKPLLVAGYGLSAITKPMFAFVGGWQGVAAIRSTERLGKALRAAPKDKLIGLSAVKGKEGASFGLHKSLDVTGEFLGLVTILVALLFWGAAETVFRNVFLISFIPGVIALLFLIFLVKDIQGGVRKKQTFSFRLEPKLRRTVLLFCGVFVFMFSEAFFVLKGNEAGLPLTQIILCLIGMRAVQVLVSIPIGRMLDRFSPQRLLSVSYVLGALAMACLIPNGNAYFVLAFLIFGVHDVMVMNAIRTFISKNALNIGSAFGIFYLLYAMSAAAGAAIVGLLWGHFGVQTVVLICNVGVLFFLGCHVLTQIKPSNSPQI